MFTSNKLRVIAFDADDTLWENETIFNRTQEKCKGILKGYVDPHVIDNKIYQTEINNLAIFGYGVKGFTLSMIETAIELSEGRVTGKEIQKLIDLGKDMLAHPIDLIDGVQETIDTLSRETDYELMIITKGDLFDQESKIARSGLADYFGRIEIVSEKDDETYRELLKRHHIAVEEFLMIGNSLKSDILPICRLGGQAVHIPFHTTWGHEVVETHHLEGYEYHEIDNLRQVLSMLSPNNQALGD